MSNKELDKASVITDCISGKHTINEASQLLGITTRQVSRLKTKVRENGIKGLVHQSRGKESNRKIPEGIEKNIVEIINDKY